MAYLEAFSSSVYKLFLKDSRQSDSMAEYVARRHLPHYPADDGSWETGRPATVRWSPGTMGPHHLQVAGPLISAAGFIFERGI